MISLFKIIAWNMRLEYICCFRLFSHFEENLFYIVISLLNLFIPTRGNNFLSYGYQGSPHWQDNYRWRYGSTFQWFLLSALQASSFKLKHDKDYPKWGTILLLPDIPTSSLFKIPFSKSLQVLLLLFLCC